MKRHIALFTVVAVALIILAGGCAAVLYFVPPAPFWLPIVLLIVCVIGLIVLLLHIKQLYTEWLHRLVGKLDPEKQTALQQFPMPTLLLSEIGEIVYANDMFSRDVMNGETLVFGSLVTNLFADLTAETLAGKYLMNLERGGRKYTAYISSVHKRNECHYVVYLVDDTDLKDIAEEYAASRPVVLQMSVDNLEDATEHLGSGVRAQISGRIESLVEGMVSEGRGLCQKYGNDRYVAITEQRHLQALMNDAFPILKQIREVCPESEKAITISIGVGAGETIEECRAIADKSLNMAMNCGGDQVAVPKADGSYTHFGGHSQSEKRRNKIRSRSIAIALRKAVETSDRVIVIGHKESDLDAVGSAIGLAAIIRKCGREAYVCVDRDTSEAKNLIDYLTDNGKEDLFVEAHKARSLVTDDTMLIMVDNQTVGRLDAPSDLFDKFKHTVVIDHHHENPMRIKPTEFFHLETTASSTCELVTEMLPYFSDAEVDRIEAEALLSGIYLDSRDFVFHTSELTFEAASYLCSRKADPITVKKLFTECLEFYQLKTDLVVTAQAYRDTVISASENNYKDYSTAAAQAANELLYFPNTLASFVITRQGDDWKISARSFGDSCNVGLVMKQLKGGGVQEMAGAQLPGTMTLEQARDALTTAIDIVVYGETQITENTLENIGG